MYRNIPEVMTFKECQLLLRVGKNTLLELLHTRQLDGFRIGNRWRVTKESVVEFMERREKKEIWDYCTVPYFFISVKTCFLPESVLSDVRNTQIFSKVYEYSAHCNSGE